MRHPNVLAYLNAQHSNTTLGEQFTFSDELIAILARHYSPEGWAEMLKMAGDRAHDLWHPKKSVTEIEAYRLNLLPKVERVARGEAGA